MLFIRTFERFGLWHVFSLDLRNCFWIVYTPVTVITSALAHTQTHKHYHTTTTTTNNINNNRTKTEQTTYSIISSVIAVYFTTNSWSSPYMVALALCVRHSSEAVWKWRWTFWAPVPNKPTVSVNVKQHFNFVSGLCWPPTFGLSSFLQSVAMDVRICKYKSMVWPNGIWGDPQVPTPPSPGSEYSAGRERTKVTTHLAKCQ